jgi:hypothetical protein
MEGLEEELTATYVHILIQTDSNTRTYGEADIAVRNGEILI